MTIDRPTYRVSYLNEFEFCSYSWYLHHIENKRSVGTYYTARGTASHTARELNLKQKIKSYKDLPLNPMLDAARDKINQLVNENEVDLHTQPLDGLGKRAAAGRIIDSTVKIVAIDRQNLQSVIQPQEVEVTVTVSLPDWPFNIRMRMDSIDADHLVTDAKTSKTRWNILKAANQYQPKIYKLGYRAHKQNDIFAGFRYHVVTCTPKQQRLSAYPLIVNPSYRQIVSVLNRFLAMHNSIEAGIFQPCHQGHWKCSPEYCHFYRECKYAT